MNMRGQKVKPWIDYRKMFLVTRWSRLKTQLWTAEDQKHWSMIYKRKQVVDYMEAATGGTYEVECLREVIRSEAETILSGKNEAFYRSLSSKLSTKTCGCTPKPSKDKDIENLCSQHDKTVIRDHLRQHMSVWLDESQKLGSTKDYCKTVKLFEDRVRTLLRCCGRVPTGLDYDLPDKTIVYDSATRKLTTY